MNKIKKSGIVIALLALAIFVLVGCGEDKSGNTINEPDITGEYLAGEYAEQLLTDGAETTIGYISITESDGSYQLKLSEKEVVQNSAYEEGYYIADTNVTKDLTLGIDPRIACTEDGELVVKTPDEFIEYSKNHPDQLYTVYIMDTSAELILTTAPEDVMSE